MDNDKQPDDKQQDVTVQPTNESNTSSHDVPPHSPASKRKWLGLVATVILVVAIVVGAWYIVTVRDSPKQSAPTKTQVAPVTPADQALTVPAEALSGQAISAKTITSVGGQTDDGLVVFDFAPYQVSGVSFKVLPAKGTGIAAIKDTVAASTAFTAASKAFADEGYTKVSSDKADSGGFALRADIPVVSYAIYANDNAVCSVADVDATKTSVAKHLVSTGCANISDYKSAANAAEPFAAAYTKSASGQSKLNSLVMSTPDIASGEKGSQRAIVYLRDAVAPQSAGTHLYYRESTTASWQFLASIGSKQVTCSLFTTEASKSAFKNIACYDEKTRKNSTVQ